jgi:hypothetical protein
MTTDPLALSPQAAWELLREDPRALLVDIRSTMEFLFVGHPVGAVHIPWIDEPDWTTNPHFVPEIRKLLLGGASCEPADCAGDPDLPQRQTLAGSRTCMHQAGLERVYHIDRASRAISTPITARHPGRMALAAYWEQC